MNQNPRVNVRASGQVGRETRGIKGLDYPLAQWANPVLYRTISSQDRLLGQSVPLPVAVWIHILPPSIAGFRTMIGKGNHSPLIKEAVKKYKAVYFTTMGGVGAFLVKSIKQEEVIAYEYLGAEAIRQLNMENFPAIGANDIFRETCLSRAKPYVEMGVCHFCIGWDIRTISGGASSRQRA